MKLLTTSDWQTQFANINECEHSRDELLAIAEKEKPDAIIHFGDLKNAYNPLDLRVAKFWVHTTSRIVKAGFDFYVLLGNHDRISQNRESQNWLDILRAAGAHTISKPRVVSIGDGTVFFLPFTSDRKQERRWASSLANYAKRNGPKLLAFHTQIIGAWLNNDISAVDGITPSQLHADTYTLCLGGHLHKHQRISDSNIFYIGSPFCQDWGEANSRKGHVLVELVCHDSFKVQQIPTKIPLWYDAEYLQGFNKKPEPGAYIRSRVLVKSKHVRDGIQQEEKRLRAKYGNKVRLFVIPRLEQSRPDELVLKGTTDKELIASYIAATLPDDSRFSAKQAVSYLSARLQDFAGASNLRSVRFLKAWGDNVLSFREVNIPYKHQGIVLLRGINKDWPRRSNGAGKTNTLSLLPVALFGQTLKNQKHDEWARENTKHSAVVNLLMKVNRKHEVWITRTRRPHSLSCKINGKDVSTGIRSSGKQETQGLIENVVGFDMRLLLNSVYLDQTIANSFVFGTQKDRMDIVERLLQIERFDDAIKLVNKDISHSRSMVDKLHTKLEELDIDITDLKVDLADITSQITTNWQQKASKARKDVRQKHLVKVSLSQIKDTYNEKRDEESEVKRRVDEATKQLSDYTGILQYWTKQATVAADLLSKGKCSKCGQPSKNAGRSMLTKAEQELYLYEGYVRAAEAGIKKLNAKWRVLEEAIAKYSIAVQDADIELKAARETLIEIEQGEREEKKRNAEHLRRRKNLFHKLATARRLFKAAERSYKRANIDLELLQYAKDAFSRKGMPLYLAATMCPVLNASADGYAEMFGGQLKLRFDVEDQKFIVDAINPTGSSVLNGQSNGESAMAGLIAALAVRDLAPKTNLLIIDEPGNGLDPEGARMFAEELLKLKTKFETVIVTTHNPSIESVLSGETIWTVRKKDGISRLSTSVLSKAGAM